LHFLFGFFDSLESVDGAAGDDDDVAGDDAEEADDRVDDDPIGSPEELNMAAVEL
jgi:hypothetical protein